MKRLILLYASLFCATIIFGQPSAEDSLLKPQKENIITAETIVKIENMGWNINSELAELRPTVSADGNLLFFICENHPLNHGYNSIRNSQDI